MAAISQLETLIIKDRVGQLCQKMQDLKKSGSPVDLSSAYRSLATDVITEYSFPQSYNFLGAPGFAKNFHTTLMELAHIALWNRQLGWLLPLFMLLPHWLVRIINPSAVPVVEFQNVRASHPSSRTLDIC